MPLRPPEGGPTIIAIDDSIDDRLLLRAAITRVRPEVRLSVYSTGLEGLAAVRFYRPSAVIVDLNMPDMSGADVLAAIQADNRVKDIPVAVLTGAVADADVNELLTAGAFAVVAKPHDMGLIVKDLLRACGL